MTEKLTLAEISAEVLNTNFTEIEDAVNAKAELNGDSTEKFNVADAVELTEAINKGQLNTAVSAINSDIAELENELATKAGKNGDSSEKFSIADATESTQAVSKGQLDSSVDTINSEITELEDAIQSLTPSVKFCMNSGNVDVNGEADLLTYSELVVSTKTGGSYAPAIGTNANGTQIEINTAKTLTISTSGSWVDWAQPVVTSNTSHGTISASSEHAPDGGGSYYAYEAADASITTDWLTSSGIGSWNWALPATLKISSITLYTNNANSGRSAQTAIYTSSDKTTQIGTTQTFVNAPQASLTFTPSSPVVTNNIYIDIQSGISSYVGLCKIVINAQYWDGGSGDVNIFVKEDETLEYFTNTIYKQKAQPSSPVTDDVWLNTSVMPLTAKKYNGTSWDNYSGIPIGVATLSGGEIASIESFPYNQNGYDVNIYTTSEKKYDYANPISKSAGVLYTAETNGLVYAQGSLTSTDCTITISGVTYRVHSSSSQGSVAGGALPITKGQTYQFSAGDLFRFIPQVRA